MQYFLHLTSSNFKGTNCIPLDVGCWSCKDGAYFLDKTVNEFELCDAFYEVADIDGDNEDSPHYSAFIDALSPMFKREQTEGEFVIDGISYKYSVKTHSL